MIRRIKTVTYEVRSHGQKTVLSSEGKLLKLDWDIPFCIGQEGREFKATVKKTIKHFQDILKAIKKLEKKAEKENACLPSKH